MSLGASPLHGEAAKNPVRSSGDLGDNCYFSLIHHTLEGSATSERLRHRLGWLSSPLRTSTLTRAPKASRSRSTSASRTRPARSAMPSDVSCVGVYRLDRPRSTVDAAAGRYADQVAYQCRALGGRPHQAGLFVRPAGSYRLSQSRLASIRYPSSRVQCYESEERLILSHSFVAAPAQC